MKIDGYTPPDKKIATEIGVEFEYSTKYGKLFIRAKSSGKENIDFRKASDELTARNKLREKTGQEQSSEETMAEYIGLWFDTVVISWDTTIKSGGNAIEATRDNFIELLTDELFVQIFTALISDCANASLYQREAEKDIAKN